jgi:low affinity Fe/Cu permease
MTGAAVCELFSSGGFYFFSGRFEETTLIEFGQRLVQYFPHYVGSLVFYIGIAVVIHIMFTFIQGSFRAHNNRTI